MKILSLNTWHGDCGPALKNYLQTQLNDVDIFCFQETNGESITAILSELFHADQFSLAVTEKVTDSDRHYSLHTYIKKPLELLTSESLFPSDDIETGCALATTIGLKNGSNVTVINVHGVPFKLDDKLDTDGRIRQTDTIISRLKNNEIAHAVICGDFNLLPEAKSVTNFTQAGLRNMIADYAVPTTRNKLAWDRFPDNIQYFADYTFVTAGLTVLDFSVPANEVSDHLPMITELAVGI